MSLRFRLERRLARAAMRLPRPWMAALFARAHRASGVRAQVGELVLDEQVQLAIALHRFTGKKHTHELSIDAARRELDQAAAFLAPEPPALERVEDRTIPGPAGPMPARVYVPRGLSRPAPALVFFHGGGFALGGLASHDAPCRVLADDGRAIVVSIDYRLAPEHKFPAAVDDCLAAFRWVAANAATLGVDARRIGVGGDSAGGNLAAVVSHLTRDDAVRPAMQLLVYPATDFTMSAPSHAELGRGYFLERQTMEWFRAHYLRGPDDVRDPRASPLFYDAFVDLPPAFVATAGFDPLRDEGEAYADKLRAAGVPVTARRYASLFHGFLSTSGSIEAARAAVADLAAALRTLLP